MGSIGERIKMLRIEKGISQEDVAMKLGISRQTVTKWETDKVQPGMDNIALLCQLFDVSADYLFVAINF